jgi:hypothetical protein
MFFAGRIKAQPGFPVAQCVRGCGKFATQFSEK